MRHGNAVGSVAASQHLRSHINPELGLLSLWSFTCSPHRASSFLPLPQNMPVGAIGLDTLPLYANVHLVYPGCMPLDFLTSRVPGKVLRLTRPGI